MAENDASKPYRSPAARAHTDRLVRRLVAQNGLDLPAAKPPTTLDEANAALKAAGQLAYGAASTGKAEPVEKHRIRQAAANQAVATAAAMLAVEYKVRLPDAKVTGGDVAGTVHGNGPSLSL